MAILATCGCGLPTQEAQSTPQRLSSSDKTSFETWDAVFVGQTKIGYVHTISEPLPDDRTASVRIRSTSVLKMTRFGQDVEIRIEVDSTESVDGALKSFRCKTIAGPSPILVEGTFADERLLLETESQGKRLNGEMAWDEAWGGFFAVEQSLRKTPMKLGETRELKSLMPGLTGVQAVAASLHSERFEETELLDGTRRLLRIAVTMQIGTQQIDILYWMDSLGEVLKSHVDILDQTTYRTVQEQATAAVGDAEFDIGRDLIIPVSVPLPQPHQTQSVVYRVTLRKGDPTRAFFSGASQEVRSVGAHEAIVTVRAIRPPIQKKTPAPKESPKEMSGPRTPADAPPTDAELATNNLIQSDDPQIRQLAVRIAADTEDPWDVCVALERWVHDEVRAKNFSQGFATAADVIRTREGDCTEHAVLLAALCRAAGIPARVVVGLVFSEHHRGFAFHMWNEAWTNDRWIPLDATLGLGGIGAAHLKLRHSALTLADAEDAILSVIGVLNQLKIDVVEISD